MADEFGITGADDDLSQPDLRELYQSRTKDDDKFGESGNSATSQSARSLKVNVDLSKYDDVSLSDLHLDVRPRIKNIIEELFAEHDWSWPPLPAKDVRKARFYKRKKHKVFYNQECLDFATFLSLIIGPLELLTAIGFGIVPKTFIVAMRECVEIVGLIIGVFAIQGLFHTYAAIVGLGLRASRPFEIGFVYPMWQFLIAFPLLGLFCVFSCFYMSQTWMVRKEMYLHLKGYNYHWYSKNMWDSYQSFMHCCGIDNYHDWHNYGPLMYDEKETGHIENVPNSCCKSHNCTANPRPSTVFQDGCLERTVTILTAIYCVALICVFVSLILLCIGVRSTKESARYAGDPMHHLLFDDRWSKKRLYNRSNRREELFFLLNHYCIVLGKELGFEDEVAAAEKEEAQWNAYGKEMESDKERYENIDPYAGNSPPTPGSFDHLNVDDMFVTSNKAKSMKQVQWRRSVSGHNDEFPIEGSIRASAINMAKRNDKDKGKKPKDLQGGGGKKKISPSNAETEVQIYTSMVENYNYLQPISQEQASDTSISDPMSLMFPQKVKAKDFLGDESKLLEMDKITGNNNNTRKRPGAESEPTMSDLGFVVSATNNLKTIEENMEETYLAKGQKNMKNIFRGSNLKDLMGNVKSLFNSKKEGEKEEIKGESPVLSIVSLEKQASNEYLLPLSKKQGEIAAENVSEAQAQPPSNILKNPPIKIDDDDDHFNYMEEVTELLEYQEDEHAEEEQEDEQEQEVPTAEAATMEHKILYEPELKENTEEIIIEEEKPDSKEIENSNEVPSPSEKIGSVSFTLLGSQIQQQSDQLNNQRVVQLNYTSTKNVIDSTSFTIMNNGENQEAQNSNTISSNNISTKIVVPEEKKKQDDDDHNNVVHFSQPLQKTSSFTEFHYGENKIVAMKSSHEFAGSTEHSSKKALQEEEDSNLIKPPRLKATHIPVLSSKLNFPRRLGETSHAVKVTRVIDSPSPSTVQTPEKDKEKDIKSKSRPSKIATRLKKK